MPKTGQILPLSIAVLPMLAGCMATPGAPLTGNSGSGTAILAIQAAEAGFGTQSVAYRYLKSDIYRYDVTLQASGSAYAFVASTSINAQPNGQTRAIFSHLPAGKKYQAFVTAYSSQSVAISPTATASKLFDFSGAQDVDNTLQLGQVSVPLKNTAFSGQLVLQPASPSVSILGKNQAISAVSVLLSPKNGQPLTFNFGPSLAKTYTLKSLSTGTSYQAIVQMSITDTNGKNPTTKVYYSYNSTNAYFDPGAHSLEQSATPSLSAWSITTPPTP